MGQRFRKNPKGKEDWEMTANSLEKTVNKFWLDHGRDTSKWDRDLEKI